MINANVFRAIADFATGAKERRDAEHEAFLAFYRDLVETLPTAATRLFGTLSGIDVVLEDGTAKRFGIELNASDFIWWKKHIDAGTRFVAGPLNVQLDMLERIATKAEAQHLGPDDRKKLIALLLEPQDNPHA